MLRRRQAHFISPNWAEFFVDTDLTDGAREKLLKEIDSEFRKQKLTLEQEQAPEVRLGSHCSNPYPCEFKEHCWKDVPKGSSLELYRSRKCYDIYYEQSEFINEINTKEVKLTEFQMRQWMASQQEEPVADLESIRKELLSLKFPLYFFDFETIAPAMPILDGMASYQRIPVQWSCHVMQSPESEIGHFEYLVDPKSKVDPRQACADSMAKLFSAGFGTVIAYHDSFEKGVIRELAEQVDDQKGVLRESLNHFWDLEKIFQKYYYHRDMEGSCSIKTVLPHFAPELSYKDLDIQEGGSAEAWLNKMFRETMPDNELLHKREQLLAYCKRDTEAMLVIFRKLIEMFDRFEWKQSQLA